MKHLPNLLTAARLALAPYLFLLMFRHRYSTIIPLFILIGITDVVDGFLARRYGASSSLGAYLDPVADKVLLSGTFLVLALTGAIEWWLAAVVLGRDLMILAAAGVLYIATARRNFPPSPWGKISTLVQIVFLCFQIGYLAGIAVAPAVTALKWLTVALAVASLADYARRVTAAESR
ncbi:MAG TPA: CDP-alcohol phosphatidyltransferase family protein [Bryobacteraceae bacterium]|nr:CDP-alcohol phosphatidyltransferase family protein [Bryobacteraceae bacterium]